MSNEEKSFQKVSINWYPGHMAKAKREIKEKIDLIDIVFEVIDARIPYSSKNNDIDDIISGKPRILIMTKTDLCDMEETSRWKEFYEEKGYIVVLLDLINNPNLKELYSKVDLIIKDMNDKRINKGLKERRARVLVIGVPNVGKSTLINRLVGKKATNVGNKPGITKSLEWIRISDKLELLDTPGILMPKMENEVVANNLASMTSIKEEVLNIDSIAIYIINRMLLLYRDNIVNRYSLTSTDDIVEILDQIGKKIGAIKNNEVDYDRVYTRLLKDLREGYLGKVTFDRL